MSNRWGIPKFVEDIVRDRDKNCVYCGVSFEGFSISIKDRPSWEHIINDIRINGPENIALCCRSCNASKGAKELTEWLKSNYCLSKGISMESVSEIVRENTLKNHAST